MLTVAKICGILNRLYPGRSISVNEGAWYHSRTAITAAEVKYKAVIFETEAECATRNEGVTTSGTPDIIARSREASWGDLLSSVYEEMSKYEDSLTQEN